MESCQQALLIILLNDVCGFTIEHPGKQSKVTATMPKLLVLHFVNEDIDIHSLAEQQCRLVMEREIENGLQRGTASRRYEKNKKIFSQNFLFDVCLECGFRFSSKPSRKSKKSQSMERVIEILYKERSFQRKEILEMGTHINIFLLSHVIGERKVTFIKITRSFKTILKKCIMICRVKVSIIYIV